MSYVEKTAKKLLPILTEVKKKMIPDKKKGKNGSKPLRKANGDDQYTSDVDDEEDMILDLNKAKGKNMKTKQTSFDMKNILGYLNQGENL